MKHDLLVTAIVTTARHLGWRVVSFKRARLKTRGRERWLTNQEGDRGFPDIIAMKGERVLGIEVKTGSGRLSAEQRAWMNAFLDAGCEWLEAREKHWNSGAIEEVLR